MRDQQVRSATLWSAADIVFRQALQCGVAIALARLLSPEEFGTVALLYLFIGIAAAFADGGFSAALIQRQTVSHTDESTVFWCNLAMGSLAGACLWAAGPTIAGYYKMPILMPLTAALSVDIVLSALGAVPATLLAKRLDFRSQMKLGAVATLVSGSVAITMAWRGFGVWALVVQALTSTAMTTILLWVVSRWRPRLVFSTAAARRLFSFGGYMFGSALLDIIYNRTYTLLIGQLYGVRALGFYNQAETIKQLPVNALAAIFSRVAFPAFAATAHDAVQLRRGVRAAVRGTTLLNTPMVLGLAAVAKPLVLTLFGARWLPTVPVMQILCLGAVFWPLHVINLNALMAMGHSNVFLRLEVVKKVLGVALLVGGTFYGVLGIAWSQVAFGVMAVGINAYYSRRLLDYGVVAQLRDLLPVLAIASPMALCVFGLEADWFGGHTRPAPAVQLLCLTTLGTLGFFGVGWVCRLAALKDAVNLLWRRNVLASEAP